MTEPAPDQSADTSAVCSGGKSGVPSAAASPPSLSDAAARSSPSSRTVQWTALVLVTLLSLALLAALAEGFVRVRQYLRSGSAVSQTTLYTDDARLQLRVLKPGMRSGPVSINASGFRGPEIETPKPPGRVRIAFLGASTTFCAEASSDAAVWPHLVVEQLRAAYPGTSFDYVNAAVPGYFVSSSRTNLKHRVAQHQPDIIVIYHATNNLSRETRDLAIAEGLDDAAESGQLNWLERHSLLWELVVKNLRVRRAQQQAAESAQADTLGRGSSRKLVIDPARTGAQFQTDLRALINESGAIATRVAVATFATRLRPEQTPQQQREAAVSAFVYSPFMSVEGLLRGFARYNGIIREVAQAEGALLIDGENAIPGDAVHFADTVHFTDAGSRKMAGRVATALKGDTRIAALAAARRAP